MKALKSISTMLAGKKRCKHTEMTFWQAFGLSLGLSLLMTGLSLLLSARLKAPAAVSPKA